MCLNALKSLFTPPKAPKMQEVDPAADQGAKDALEAEFAETQRLAEQNARRSGRTAFGGIRSLISGLATGFGSNFSS